MERTFVMVKPDGVERGLTGEIIARISRKGYRLAALKMLKISPEMAARHYAEHEGKSFFAEMISFITSGPVVAMVWEGPDVIAAVRGMMGKTNPQEAMPGTIRGDFGVTISKNVIHGSDSPEAAAREIDIFFKPEEVLDYTRTIEAWIY